jgi:tetratricopeptide (TPR) repeat protein
MLQEAMAEAEQALPLEAEINDGPSVPAAYLYAGQYEKFLAKLPPDNAAAVMFYRGLGLYYLKDFARALMEFKLAYQPNNESLQASVSNALALTLTNERSASLTQLRETEKIAMARGVYDAEGFYKMAQVYAILGDKEAALHVLRHSLEGGFFCYSYFANDPLLNNLQSEAEFARLLQMAQQRHEKFRQKFFPS